MAYEAEYRSIVAPGSGKVTKLIKPNSKYYSKQN
jgi:hypothetical protein